MTVGVVCACFAPEGEQLVMPVVEQNLLTQYLLRV
jgi:hypothetical protein